MCSSFRLIPSLSILWTILPFILFTNVAAEEDVSIRGTASNLAQIPPTIPQKSVEYISNELFEDTTTDVALRLSARNAAPEPNAEANPQGNYYAFSGAIYIVASNGQQLNAASPAYCPNSAPVGCGNIGIWNWCCQSGSTCAWADTAHSVVGCCPNGQYCNGTPNQNTIQTVTVYITTTAYQAVATTKAVVVVGVTTTTPYQATTTRIVNGGYCTTIAMHADGLPTTGKAPCGTAYIVNAGVRPVARQLITAVSIFWGIMILTAGLFRVWR